MIECKKQMKINNFDKSGLLEVLLSTVMREVLHHTVPLAEETVSSTATASPTASLVPSTPVAAPSHDKSSPVTHVIPRKEIPSLTTHRYHTKMNVEPEKKKLVTNNHCKHDAPLTTVLQHLHLKWTNGELCQTLSF
jgi:hypothetical protein